MVNIENYYLDFSKMINMDDKQKSFIYDMYRDMVFNYENKLYSISNSYFTTLINNGLIISIREEKINEILK